MCFIFPQSVNSKVFQKIPDDTGMGSFLEVRSEDVKAHRTWGSIRPVPQVLSVLQLFAANEPLFPHLITLELYDATEKFIQFIPLFLSLESLPSSSHSLNPTLPYLRQQSCVLVICASCRAHAKEWCVSCGIFKRAVADGRGRLGLTERATYRRGCSDPAFWREPLK